MASKKSASKAKAAPPVANMGAGADANNAPKADKPKSVEERMSALEKAHEDHVALAKANGWSV